MITGFDPIISKQPKILILGSMPSVSSLQKQEYYGYPHNRFWKFMGTVFQMPIDTYDQKKQIILQHHLILWDVIHACEREGSLDSNIHQEEINDIETLLHTYPTIALILCNGKKSYDLYQKHFGHLSLPCVYLPSTSNANRSIQEETVFNKWQEALLVVLEGKD